MLKIVADDVSPHSCRILDADGNDTGLVQTVTAIRIDLRAGDVNAATLDLAMIRTETAVGKVEWLAHNPQTGGLDALGSMTFRDGTRVVFPEDTTSPVIETALGCLPGYEPVAECTVTMTRHGYSASGPADNQGMAYGISAGANLDGALEFVREQFAKHPAPQPGGAPSIEILDGFVTVQLLGSEHVQKVRGSSAA